MQYKLSRPNETEYLLSQFWGLYVLNGIENEDWIRHERDNESWQVFAWLHHLSN